MGLGLWPAPATNVDSGKQCNSRPSFQGLVNHERGLRRENMAWSSLSQSESPCASERFQMPNLRGLLADLNTIPVKDKFKGAYLSSSTVVDGAQIRLPVLFLMPLHHSFIFLSLPFLLTLSKSLQAAMIERDYCTAHQSTKLSFVRTLIVAVGYSVRSAANCITVLQ